MTTVPKKKAKPAVPERQPLVRRIPAFALGVALTLFLVMAVVGVLGWPSHSILAKSKRPADISYGPSVNVSWAGVIEQASVWDSITGSKHHSLVFGCDSALRYGHQIALDITGISHRDVAFSWEKSGARARFGSGHEIFVPGKYLAACR